MQHLLRDFFPRPNAVPVNHHAVRVQSNAVRLDPDAIRLDPDAVRLDSSAVRLDPNAVREGKNAVPESQQSPVLAQNAHFSLKSPPPASGSAFRAWRARVGWRRRRLRTGPRRLGPS